MKARFLLSLLVALLVGGCGSSLETQSASAPAVAAEREVRSRVTSFSANPTTAGPGTQVRLTAAASPGEQVRLYRTSPTGAAYSALYLTANSYGVASTSWTASTPYGNWKWECVDSTGATSTVYVNVTQALPSPTPSPSVAASPSGVIVGTTTPTVALGGNVTLNVNGGTPGAWARLYYQEPNGAITAWSYVYPPVSFTDRSVSRSQGVWKFWAVDPAGLKSNTVQVQVGTTPLSLSQASSAYVYSTQYATVTGAAPYSSVTLERRDPYGYLSTQQSTTDATGRASFSWTPTYRGYWTLKATAPGAASPSVSVYVY